MNFLLLGDLSEKLIKACDKEGYSVVSLSKAILSAMSQNEYMPNCDISKQENSLWKLFIFGFSTSADVALLTKVRENILPKICQNIVDDLEQRPKFLVHFNVYSEKILNFFGGIYEFFIL